VPVDVEPEPEPELEPVAIEPAPEPMAMEPEPEPVAAEPPTPAPEPEPVVASQATQAPQPDVKATMLRWPTQPGLQENGQNDSGEAATTIIPAWQPTEMPSDSKRTVSLQAMPTEARASGEPYAAKLTFESGPFAGRIVALPDQMVTVGRAPDNDVVVGDPATSGRHGRIEVRAGAFWISDLGSTNGTLVNGEPVIERQLLDGDLIAIGQNTIRFTIE
jgi:pSer/pThr/pTyr-binding forkhead associated (FHA) protein